MGGDGAVLKLELAGSRTGPSSWPCRRLNEPKLGIWKGSGVPMAVPMGLLQTRTTQGSAEDKPSTKTLVFDTHLLNRIFDRMSAMGH